MWPITLFSDDTEIDSSSDDSFRETFHKIQSEHNSSRGVYLFNEAVGKIAMNIYVKNGNNISYEYYSNTSGGYSSNYSEIENMLLSKFYNNRDMVSQFRERIDGMELIDVINEGEEAHKETQEILEESKKEYSLKNSYSNQYDLYEMRYEVAYVNCEEWNSGHCIVGFDKFTGDKEGRYTVSEVIATLDFADLDDPNTANFEPDCWNGQCMTLNGNFMGLDPNYSAFR
ncbi:hypothetical protein [Halomonas sp. CSM-2]|uniref:hypothetical protein n=1 Tax=Halomonas sp. CSM-2 TaxID=1975722 RepID=UPI000A280EE9|nr:hypothetical protein [Halomonas sp. CSM-2]